MALIVLEEEGWGEGAPAKGYLAPEVFRVKKSDICCVRCRVALCLFRCLLVLHFPPLGRYPSVLDARRRKGMLGITRDGWWNGMIGGWTVTEKQSLFFIKKKQFHSEMLLPLHDTCASD